MNRQEDILKIENMKIGDWFDTTTRTSENSCRMKVIRVPGGWVYHFSKHYDSECAVFVPYERGVS